MVHVTALGSDRKDMDVDGYCKRFFDFFYTT